MALRTIVQDGDPILKKVCRPVTKFDDRLGTLLDDMKETLLAANGRSGTKKSTDRSDRQPHEEIIPHLE